MGAEQSRKALGKVGALLESSLTGILNTHRSLGLNFSFGHPEPSQTNMQNPRINLFLYEALFDPSMKNFQPESDVPPALWFVLKYLITAFDKNGKSDSTDAHELMGEAVSALHELSFMQLTISTEQALGINPEPLKITMDDVTHDLLSKIMQGSDEKYRFSLGFQVRPVMIAPAKDRLSSLLVGVDYTAAPPTIIGEKGVQIPVIPSMGPAVESVEPRTIEPEDTIEVVGTGLNGGDIVAVLGDAELSFTMQQPDRARCVARTASLSAAALSAGMLPFCVARKLPNGRLRRGEPVAVNLRPVVTSVSYVAGGAPGVQGTLTLHGKLLGKPTDDVMVALCVGTTAIRVFDIATPGPGQTSLAVTLSSTSPVAAGEYLVVFRCNSQQARAGLKVSIA